MEWKLLERDRKRDRDRDRDRERRESEQKMSYIYRNLYWKVKNKNYILKRGH